MRLSLFSIHVHIMQSLFISTRLLRLIYVIRIWGKMDVLSFEVVIPTSSKYKNALFIVEHYYLDHTC
jgi:hypothetical protein